MKPEPNQYDMKVKIDHNLLRILPEETRDPKLPEFSSELSDTLRKLFREIGGVISILSIEDEEINIIWKNEDIRSNPFNGVIDLLNRSEYEKAIFLLEIFKGDEPDNPDILYNLGMAYSDLAELSSAQDNLQRLLELEPSHVNGRVALGVALMRDNQNQAAKKELKKALDYDPDNPWAHRNLGACLLQLEKYQDALSHLQQATLLNPDDERSWFGLGQAHEQLGQLKDADAAYRKVLYINEYGEIAKQARQGLSSLAEKTFKAKTPQAPRMDAVMYCLGALEKFENLSESEIKNIGIEIAMLGMSGIQVNNPEQQYTLNSLPGKFTGLHLLCMEYVAFSQVEPDLDIGFDLSEEYSAAIKLYESRK